MKAPKQLNTNLNGGSHFIVSIHYQENYSWQGVLQWLDTGKTVHFRSELEMMTLINAALQSTQSDARSFRTWSDDETLKSVK